MRTNINDTEIDAVWCVDSESGIEYLVSKIGNEVLAKRVNGVIQETI